MNIFDDKFFPLRVFIVVMVTGFIILTTVCISVNKYEKKEEARTYVAQVELPTGEIKQYEIDDYEIGSGGSYVFTLMDGKEVRVKSNNVIIEETTQEN